MTTADTRLFVLSRRAFQRCLAENPQIALNLDEVLLWGTLESDLGPEAAERYRAWVAFRRSGLPLILLIGGCTGTGKSTVAAELALRLDIGRSQSTDILREVTRLLVPERVAPELHASTFEAWRALPGTLSDEVATLPLLIQGYRSQAAKVALAMDGVIERDRHVPSPRAHFYASRIAVPAAVGSPLAMSDIVLVTLNARYIHCSLGLCYLLANLGELQPRARLLELTIQDPPAEVVEKILAERPVIVGFGVYVWNARETEETVALLKRVAPAVGVVLGGPEVSYETDRQPICALADYVVTGPGELAFAALCTAILRGTPPAEKVIGPEPAPLTQIRLPYRLYTDTDIAHRVLYVEASRGCPFRCAFCLSALDRTVTPFLPEAFLGEIERLWQRGARCFKFVDRTFNLRIDHARAVLDFFLDRVDDRPFLHFEMVPDRVREALREPVARFPPGTLQLEIGIQTFNREVQAAIGRCQDNDAAEANLRWLREHSHAHLHTDLIFGLPGEDLASLGRGFDRLVGLRPHEIQVGILKRLRGAPLCRLGEERGLVFSPYPPYSILQSDRLDFATIQRLKRFARYWDLVGNSGRFGATLPLLLGDRPFERFLAVSDWLFAETGQTHRIALERLFRLLELALCEVLALPRAAVAEALDRDRDRRPAGGRRSASREGGAATRDDRKSFSATPSRQRRHSVDSPGVS